MVGVHEGGGGEIDIRVHKFDRVVEIKALIARRLGVPQIAPTLQLFVDGQELSDTRHMIRDPYGVDNCYNLAAGTKLKLVSPMLETIDPNDNQPPPSGPAPDVTTVRKLRMEDYSYEAVENYFRQLFDMCDANKNGVLEKGEVRDLLLRSGFKLDQHTMEEVMAKADKNGDGVLDHSEMVPMLMGLLMEKSSTQKLDLRKYTKEQLEIYFTRLFKMCDTDNSGDLDFNEVTDLLERTGFEFNAATIEEIVRNADVDHDGTIDLEELVVWMVPMLLEYCA